MSREIKFRAWDGGAMSTPFGLGDAHTSFNDCKSYYKVNSDCDSWTLMQYTGLKDKNGKEIYEGDVINIDKDGEDTAVIEWNRGCAAFQCNYIGSYHDNSSHLYGADLCEVIGNIYENPELLEKHK